MHRFTRRIGDVSARRPWATLGVWLAALTIVLGLAATSSGSFVDDLVAPGSSSEQAQRLLEERFPDAAAGSALAVLRAPDGQRLEEHRAAVSAALAKVADVEHVTAVVDPFTAGTVSFDGRTGLAAVTFDRPSMEVGPEPLTSVYDALSPARQAGLVAEVGGEAAFINAESAPSGAEAAGLLAALVVLVVAFGSVVAALLPVVLAVVAVAAGLGGIALMASSLTVSTAAPTIGAMIGLGVGIDYALLVVARYRENRSTDMDNASALSAATATAGSAVLFAGGTVVVAMLALALTGMGFLASIGLATALIVLLAMATALTLLPALLSLLGDRIETGRIGRRDARAPRAQLSEGTWWRFAHHVAARPWRYLLGGTVLLIALAASALDMRTGFPDAGHDSPTTSHRQAYDLVADGFGPGTNGPLLLVVDLTAEGADAGDLPTLAWRLAADPGVAAVSPPRTSAAGDTAVLTVLPTTASTDPETSQTLGRIRELAPANSSVTGVTAMTEDLTDQLTKTLPVFVLAVLGVSLLLMVLVFRSVVVPLKAVVLNVLSIGAAYGVTVAVFQWGWGLGLLGVEETMPIVSVLPVLWFAILFGLSMDYEVFLLSRIREEYDATGDPTESVARGLAATGRVITSAALIMTVVFLSFVASATPGVMMTGLGMATAILVDATLVRMLLVPAAMSLLGRSAWWLPRGLDRILPRVSVDGSALPAQRAASGVREPALSEPVPTIPA